MTRSVPNPIATYFAGSNAKDPDATLAAFADGATVIDEGKTYAGLPAINGWLEHVFEKYGVTSTVTDVVAKDGLHRVAALVSGNFPGSPATLHYDFVLAGERIERLSIG